MLPKYGLASLTNGQEKAGSDSLTYTMHQGSSSVHKALLGAWPRISFSGSCSPNSADKHLQLRLSNPRSWPFLRWQEMRDIESVAWLVCRQGKGQQMWVRSHLLHPPGQGQVWLCFTHPWCGLRVWWKEKVFQDAIALSHGLSVVPFLPHIPHSALLSLSSPVCPLDWACATHPRKDPRLQGGSFTKARSHSTGARAPHHAGSSQHTWVMLCSSPCTCLGDLP